jgi:signal transduction histidine kinase
MAKEHTRPRRRRYLIDRRFQLPVALTLAGLGLVMLVYHLVVVHFVVEGARAGMIVTTQPLYTMIPLVVVLVVAAAWLGVHVTHRIVGPAYRLVQTMHAYVDGDYAVRSHLRKGDSLKEVAAALNELGEALVARNHGETEVRAKLRAAIREGAPAEELLALLGDATNEEEE